MEGHLAWSAVSDEAAEISMQKKSDFHWFQSMQVPFFGLNLTKKNPKV